MSPWDDPPSRAAAVSEASETASETASDTVSTTARTTAADATTPRQRKGPLSFLTGSITSFGLGWCALQLSYRVVGYYAEHPPHYDVRFAQSIAVFMKTLIVGMSFLATFTFAFVGLGLFFTFLRSLMPGWSEAEQTP